MLFKRLLIAILLSVLPFAAARGETIWLKGGRIIEGTIVRTTSQEIEVKTERVSMVIPRDQIERISSEPITPVAPIASVTSAAPVAPSPPIADESAVTPIPIPVIAAHTIPAIASPEPLRSETPTTAPGVAMQPKKDITQISSEELRGLFAESLQARIEGQTTGTQKILQTGESPFAMPEPKATLALAPLTGTSAIAPLGEPQQEEFRGIYVTQFEWADKNAETLKDKLPDMLDRIKQANFNVVLLQVRGYGDALYRSEIEPRSALLGAQDPGFDPLQYAIDQAHARGLQLHAAVNLLPIWQGDEPPPARTPLHPFLLHCQDLSPLNWLCCTENAQPMDARSIPDTSYWLSPGIPEVQTYLRKVVVDIVKRYGVDGILLDGVRYPGRQFSQDKVSTARFQRIGNPDQLTWDNWQRQQLNRLIRDIGAEIRAEKPSVSISAAVWGIYDRSALPAHSQISDGRNDYYQDPLAWLGEGSVDAIMPMIYCSIKGSEPHFDDLLKSFLAGAPAKRVIPSISPLDAKGDWREEIDLARRTGTSGAAIFSYSALTQGELWERLTETVFAKPARVPPLAMIPGANTGMIIGYVSTAETRKGIEDCIVEIRGTSQHTFTSGDGFFALVNVTPSDNIAVLARREDVGSAIVSNISLAPQETKRIAFAIARPPK